MKVSSLTPLPMEALHGRRSTPPLWQRVGFLYQRLDRLLARIAFAEAGNFDAVREMLDQEAPAKHAEKPGRAHPPRRSGGVIWEDSPAWPFAADCLRQCVPTRAESPCHQRKWG